MPADGENLRRVVFVARAMTQYRVPFHERVRALLRERGIHYDLVYCAGRREEEARGDLVAPDWARQTVVTYLGRGQRLCWQHGLLKLGKADLVILGQENALLANYPLIASSLFSRRRLAFFGHGRNFQGTSASAAERFKRYWATKVHWWFAYTPRAKAAVVEAGFPSSKVTVFNNAVDSSSIRASLARLDPALVAQLRVDLVQGSPHVGVYVGGLYPRKRIPFLLEAAQRVRQAVPDFHLIIIGGGPDADRVGQAAGQYDWIHPVGPKFGDEKAALMSLATVMLMPGLVGLAILDSFAYGTPMVTCDLPFHSPEIDYLANGINGVMVKDSDNPASYAEAVIRVLTDPSYRAELQQGGQRSLKHYSIESMAERFVDGVVAALAP